MYADKIEAEEREELERERNARPKRRRWRRRSRSRSPKTDRDNPTKVIVTLKPQIQTESLIQTLLSKRFPGCEIKFMPRNQIEMKLPPGDPMLKKMGKESEGFCEVVTLSDAVKATIRPLSSRKLRFNLNAVSRLIHSGLNEEGQKENHKRFPERFPSHVRNRKMKSDALVGNSISKN